MAYEVRAGVRGAVRTGSAYTSSADDVPGKKFTVASRFGREIHLRRDPSGRHEGHDSSVPLAHPLQTHDAMEPLDRQTQREALERLQNEMREHVADAAALADRIAALQLRIDNALAELAKPSNPDTESAVEKVEL